MSVATENTVVESNARAHRIASDHEAIQIAQELRRSFAVDSARRDEKRIFPVSEIEAFSRSGLWAITVPRTYGGAEVSASTLAEVVALISEADASIGQIPQNHYFMVRSAMALVTEHLGFGVTCSLTYEHPYPFARRMSTLDHLTKGRAGWNIVSSYLDSAARNFGMKQQIKHDDRYAVADEYMEVCYKLWETSWEDNAVVRDIHSGVFTEPEKVHPIEHYGEYFQVPGYHLCEPSPQRTPVLYQAGASRRGKDFAARHAECIFVAAPSKTILKNYVSDIRRRAAGFGRDPSQLLFFNLFTVIVAPTEVGSTTQTRRVPPICQL